MGTPGLGTAPAPVASKEDLDAIRLQLTARLNSGANWFFWIAGLSLVNTLLAALKADRRFILGLGITQIVDEIAKLSGGVGVITIAINVLIAGLFILFGLQARKQKKWAFVVGMILYSLDALIFVVGVAVLDVGFHILALVYLAKGFKSLKELKAINSSPQVIAAAAD